MERLRLYDYGASGNCYKVRLLLDDPEAIRRREAGDEVLALLEGHLRAHEFLVGDRYTVADIAVYAYTHVAPEAGYDLAKYPSVNEWLRRLEGQPRFVNDLEP